MLNLTNISVSFGGRDLYKNISFQINMGQDWNRWKKWCWENYALKLITGDQQPNSGSIQKQVSSPLGISSRVKSKLK